MTHTDHSQGVVPVTRLRTQIFWLTGSSIEKKTKKTSGLAAACSLTEPYYLLVLSGFGCWSFFPEDTIQVDRIPVDGIPMDGVPI